MEESIFSCRAIAVIITDQAEHVIHGLAKRIRCLSVLTSKTQAMLDSIKLIVSLELSSLVCDTDSSILYSIV